MAGIISTDLIDISLCELDDWDGALGALDAESQIQGNNCLTITYTGAGLRAKTMKSISSAVLTNKNIYGWLTFARLAMLLPTSSGGIRLRVEDGTYFAEWYVGGSDSATSGWMCYTCNCGVHPDRHGTLEDTDDANEPNYGAITKVGWRVNLAIKGIVKWDAFRYGTTISINEGTEGVPATFEDIWTAENLAANKYGIVYKFEGAYFAQGKIAIGSTTSDTLTYFKDSNQVVMFRDNKVPVGFYEIKLQGKSGISNKIFLGESPGIGGCTIKAPTALKWKLTATDTNITEFGFYGCNFINASTIEGQTYSALKKFKNTSFIACAEVLPYTGIVDGCNFISSPGRAIRVSSASHNVTSCNFINCQTAIHHDVGGAVGTPLHIDYSSLIFTGGTYHIENSATTPNFYIDIDRIGTPLSNPDVAKINNSAGGTTTLLAIGVQLKIYIVDSEGATITDACEVTIVRISDVVTLFTEDDIVDGLTIYSYSTGGGTATYINVHNKTGYQNKLVNNYTLPSSGTVELTIQLDTDLFYSNP